ncbi:hypothetical protein AK830_g10151 [Neonectria ditissima]|uniref:Uncharacterized protein n=1 Tax=Neonectria ditissima TaxID=78410 RepID=A0A0P7B487_9HYPO|nr:hypothetical protein AK830_g10151 [Neonectria ditissima]
MASIQAVYVSGASSARIRRAYRRTPDHRRSNGLAQAGMWLPTSPRAVRGPIGKECHASIRPCRKTGREAGREASTGAPLSVPCPWPGSVTLGEGARVLSMSAKRAALPFFIFTLPFPRLKSPHLRLTSSNAMGRPLTASFNWNSPWRPPDPSSHKLSSLLKPFPGEMEDSVLVLHSSLLAWPR